MLTDRLPYLSLLPARRHPWTQPSESRRQEYARAITRKFSTTLIDASRASRRHVAIARAAPLVPTTLTSSDPGSPPIRTSPQLLRTRDCYVRHAPDARGHASPPSERLASHDSRGRSWNLVRVPARRTSSSPRKSRERGRAIPATSAVALCSVPPVSHSDDCESTHLL